MCSKLFGNNVLTVFRWTFRVHLSDMDFAQIGHFLSRINGTEDERQRQIKVLSRPYCHVIRPHVDVVIRSEEADDLA